MQANTMLIAKFQSLGVTTQALHGMVKAIKFI